MAVSNGWITMGTAGSTGSAGTFAISDWVDCTASSANATNWKCYKYAGNKYSITWDDVGLTVPAGPLKIAAGKQDIELPDGARLVVDELGNYRIEDKDAKVTYRANRMREFSPHLNASDMLAQFVKYVGGIGVRRADVMGLPIHLFIAWLVIEAAERDGDEIPSDVIPVERDPLVRLAIKPKCLACGRFIKRLHLAHKFPFCSPEHGAIYVSRNQPVEVPRLGHAQPITAG